jgi:predicted Zn finger-like uncharacterized protein
VAGAEGGETTAMIIVCPSCQAKYKFDEEKLGERPRAKTRCAKCGGTIEIENPLLASMTLPPGTLAGTPSHVPAAGSTTQAPALDSRPPAPAPAPAPPVRTAPQAGTVTGRGIEKSIVELPRDKRFSLAVIQGPATGHIHPVLKARTVIGRSGADINIEDPEASRQHASLEILGDHAILRDMGSTNGTYVEADRIEQQVLNNQMEFRIGSHVLMFIVTDVE